MIVPVCDEAGSVRMLHRELKQLRLGYDDGLISEIIFVDDGSCDKTADVVRRLQKSDKRVRLVRFRSNLGKAAALQAGFNQAGGKIIVTIDGDRQNKPRDILLLLGKLDEGYDMVVGWRQRRRDSIDNVFFSRIFNFALRKVFGTRLHDANCGLKAMRRPVVKMLVLKGGQHRFMTVSALRNGFRIAEVPVADRPRKFGVSKYGYSRLFEAGFDFVRVFLARSSS